MTAVSPQLNMLSPIEEAWSVCRGHILGALSFSALVNLLYLAPTLYMLQVYDRVVQSGSTATLLLLTLALSGALILTVVLDRLRQRLLLLAGVRFDRIFSARIFQARLSGGAVPDARLGPIIRELDTLRAAIAGPVVLAIFDAPWMPIYIGALFIVHWSLGLMAIMAGAILLGLAILNERLARTYSRRTSLAQGLSATVMEEVSRGAPTIRALGMGGAMAQRLRRDRQGEAGPQVQAIDTNGIIAGSIRFLRLLAQSAALGLGAWLTIHRQVSPGAIFAGSMLMSRALSPVDQAVAQWRFIQIALNAYRNLKALVRAHPVTPQTLAEVGAAPRLEVKDVAVLSQERDRFLVRAISFNIGGGAILGVMGPTGAGKSTLLDCLANARPVDQGEIRLDGVRLTDWDANRLGGRVGYLPQDVLLFPGTVKENIARFSDADEASSIGMDNAILDAARRAGAHEMILSLPRGYDTEVGGRTGPLSAGQRQQIGWARALFGLPTLFILDEPNLHLDGDVVKQLIATVLSLKQEGALIIISGHSLPLAQMADALAVIRGGRLELFGPAKDVVNALRGGIPTAAAGGRA
jgi:ATP-binding cassette subfamily C protein